MYSETYTNFIRCAQGAQFYLALPHEQFHKVRTFCMLAKFVAAPYEAFIRCALFVSGALEIDTNFVRCALYEAFIRCAHFVCWWNLVGKLEIDTNFIRCALSLALPHEQIHMIGKCALYYVLELFIWIQKLCMMGKCTLYHVFELLKWIQKLRMIGKCTLYHALELFKWIQKLCMIGKCTLYYVILY